MKLFLLLMDGKVCNLIAIRLYRDICLILSSWLCVKVVLILGSLLWTRHGLRKFSIMKVLHPILSILILHLSMRIQWLIIVMRLLIGQLRWKVMVVIRKLLKGWWLKPVAFVPFIIQYWLLIMEILRWIWKRQKE